MGEYDYVTIDGRRFAGVRDVCPGSERVADDTNVKGLVVGSVDDWEAERRAFRERGDLVARYERPVVAIRAAHLPNMPIVRVMSHRDIDEALGEVG